MRMPCASVNVFDRESVAKVGMLYVQAERAEDDDQRDVEEIRYSQREAERYA